MPADGIRPGEENADCAVLANFATEGNRSFPAEPSQRSDRAASKGQAVRDRQCKRVIGIRDHPLKPLNQREVANNLRQIDHYGVNTQRACTDSLVYSGSYPDHD
jgi:hypothetical protein